MNLTRTALTDGVFLNTVRSDRFKTAFLTVNLFVPLRAETASAYSLLTDVLMRGTERFPTMELLNRKQDELYSLGLGAYVQKKGEAQVVTFELTCIEDTFSFDGMQVLAEGMKLLQELIFHPHTENGCFSEAYTEQEKLHLIDDYRARIDNKALYATIRCVEEMCKGEPYAVECGGCESELTKLNARILWDAYGKLLAQARVEIFYVGSREHSYVASLCKEQLPFTPRNADIPQCILGQPPAKLREVSESMHISQCKMVIGFRTDYTLTKPDFIHMMLFNELFGGSANSRLFLNIREKQSLCYTCSSHPDGLKGLLLINSGIEGANRQKALDGIFAEWQSIKEGRLTQEELDTAKRSLRNSYRELTDSPGSICAWYLGRICAGRTDSPEDAAKMLDAVTVADIVRVANRMYPDTVYDLKGVAE